MINPIKIHWRGRWDSNPRMDGFRDRRLTPWLLPNITRHNIPQPITDIYIFAVSAFIL